MPHRRTIARLFAGARFVTQVRYKVDYQNPIQLEVG